MAMMLTNQNLYGHLPMIILPYAESSYPAPNSVQGRKHEFYQLLIEFRLCPF
jgi:hypothetical protein